MSRRTLLSTVTAAELTDVNKNPQTALPPSESFLLIYKWLITPRKRHFVVASFWDNDTMHYLSLKAKEVVRNAKKFCFVLLS